MDEKDCINGCTHAMSIQQTYKTSLCYSLITPDLRESFHLHLLDVAPGTQTSRN